MIYSGTLDYTAFKTIYDFKNDEYVEKPVAVSVDWTAEQTELGDGRKEWDFDCSATTEDGDNYLLTEDDETKIYEQLRQNGEF